MNECRGLGLLVAAKGEVPTDPHAYGNAFASRVGCNHLVCSSCGAVVESFAGWSWNTAGHADFAVVATADLAAGDAGEAAGGALVRSEEGRLYRCKCTVHIEENESPIERYRETGTSSVGAKWQCGGHPARALPAVIAGIAVDPSAGNARDWVLAAVDAHGTRGAEAREAARVHLAELWFALAGGEVESVMTMAVAALVNDNEPHRRDQALLLYGLAPEIVGSERVGIWLAEKPEWFAASDDFPRRREVALNVARRSVEAGRPYEAPVQELFRKEALRPEAAKSFFQFMAYQDRDWFIAHAHEFPPALFGEIRRLLPYTVARAQRAEIETRMAAAGA